MTAAKALLDGLTEAQREALRKSTIVVRLARELAQRTTFLDESELQSVGNEEVTKIAARWDPTQEVPFDAFAFEGVRLRMWRAIRRARKIKTRELTGFLSEASEVLARSKDEGDVFAEKDASRRDLREHYAAVAGAVIVRWLSEGSIAPSEDELHEHAERERRRASLRAAFDEMGDQGKVIRLRHVDGLEWDEVAARLEVDKRQAQRLHAAAMPRLVALVKRRTR